LAQQARSVLPLSTKTEFVLSGFKDSWLHFFCLRSDIALTGKPHPQAQELANPLRDEFIERGYITEDELNERIKLLKDAEEKRG
jgi:thymidylate synthase (FAD)